MRGPLASVVTLLVALAEPATVAAAPLADDLALLDAHTVAASGGHALAGIFGTTSVTLGIAELAKLGNQQGSFFAGLTYLLWGGATVASASAAIDQDVQQWARIRQSMKTATPSGRRALRATLGLRLRRGAANRAIGLVADATATAIGVALLVAPQSRSRDMGRALLIDGTFLLSVDLFRAILDDQVGRLWLRRNEAEAQGYFSRLTPPAVAVAPIFTSGDGSPSLGGIVGIRGRF
jgi:hypothetical protein